jgi:protein gp37
MTTENQTYFDQRWKHLQNISVVIKFSSYEPALGSLHLPKHEPLPDWVISGGESCPKARPINPQWVRDIIAECRQKEIAPFHKQWGTYCSNPLVVEQGMSVKDAKALDNHGKGGGLVDGELIRDFPLRVR